MTSRGTGVAGNPVLIGAATILVVVVAVFLAYNANQGLPFVPTYQIKAEVPSAANLVRGNEVRIGGARVGTIDKITVRRLPDSSNVAVLHLRLDSVVEELPKDSTMVIRPRSVLGLKYLEITKGRSAEGYAPGDTVPVSASRPPQVEFDEVANTFDAQTREASRVSVDGFGTALSGRGSSINQAIGALRPLLRDVIPVARYLRDPETGLSRLIGELGDAAEIVAPASENQARLFVNLDRTFSALREVARPFIQETISEGPATLDQAVSSFRTQAPFLTNAAGLFAELRPGVRALRGAAPELAEAMRVGTPTLTRSVDLSRRTVRLLESLRSFAEDPVVPRGVRKLSETVTVLEPTLDFITPSQTVCNYLALWMRNVSSLLSEGDKSGTWERFIIIATPSGPNNEGGPSSAPASGPSPQNYLHSNPYPHTAAPGEPRECEAGNEPYLQGQVVTSNVPGTQPDRTEGNP